MGKPEAKTALIAFLLWSALAAQPAAPAELAGKQGPASPEPSPPADTAPDQLQRLRTVTYRTRPGDTFTNLFLRFGMPVQEKQLWLRAIQKQKGAAALPAGKVAHLYFTDVEASPRESKTKSYLKALEIELDEASILTWEKGSNGIVFAKRDRPYDIELKTVGGEIETSLFEDGARAGLNKTLISQLVDIFSWDVDFDKEIRKGDTFKILYEKRSRGGSEDKASFRILAVELINAGQQFLAIYFEKTKGKGAYYNLDGRSLARAFLRFPLEFASISSHFSHSRFHPILRVDRPHHGVDFTARPGTPVRAIADGKIQFAAWKKGGYGRLVEIQHDADYVSRYAHLQGFALGIRPGTKVQKGQVVGYVGSSGLSTGPHLHFELYKDQQYVDPLNFEIPPEDKIEPALLRFFENAKRLLLAELAVTPRS